MFWGCVNGDVQGPGIFWEKNWGTINSESYCVNKVPIIHGWIELCHRNGVSLKLIQNGAPGHAAGDTRAELSVTNLTKQGRFYMTNSY